MRVARQLTGRFTTDPQSLLNGIGEFLQSKEFPFEVEIRPPENMTPTKPQVAGSDLYEQYRFDQVLVVISRTCLEMHPEWVNYAIGSAMARRAPETEEYFKTNHVSSVAGTAEYSFQPPDKEGLTPGEKLLLTSKPGRQSAPEVPLFRFTQSVRPHAHAGATNNTLQRFLGWAASRPEERIWPEYAPEDYIARKLTPPEPVIALARLNQIPGDLGDL